MVTEGIEPSPFLRVEQVPYPWATRPFDGTVSAPGVSYLSQGRRAVKPLPVLPYPYMAL